jgi:hypothetical protein
MDEKVHCAPVLENRTTCLVRLNSQKASTAFNFGPERINLLRSGI